MRRLLKLLTFCLVLTISHTAATGQTSGQADSQTRVLNEIAELRADLLEYLAEAQGQKTKELTQELDKVRQKLKQLQDEDRQRTQQIDQVEEQLASPQLDASAKPQLEGWRTQLLTDSAENLRKDLAEVAQRETHLIQQLNRETQRGLKLQERTRLLQTALGRQ